MQPNPNPAATASPISAGIHPGRIYIAAVRRAPYAASAEWSLTDVRDLDSAEAAALLSAPSSARTASTSAFEGLLSKLLAMASAVRNRSYVLMAADSSDSGALARLNLSSLASKASMAFLDGMEVSVFEIDHSDADSVRPAPTVVLYAPAGWGKTTRAPAIARALGCAGIVDEWQPTDALTPGALHLTNAVVVAEGTPLQTVDFSGFKGAIVVVQEDGEHGGAEVTARVQREVAATGSPLQGEVRNGLAGAAHHDGLLDTDPAKYGIRPATGAAQIGASAAVATPSLGVVLRKAPKLVLLLLGLRLRLLGLRSQVLILALQRPDALTQKSQMLAEHRRRAALVDQRLQFIEKRVKHFILRCPSTADGSHLEGGAA